MAYIITAKILVDAESDVIAEKMAHHLLEQSVGNVFIDFSTERVAQVNSAIDDAITNETYSVGYFSESWVIFSPTKNEVNDNGYWSNEYGWTDKDLATIYDSENVSLPEGVDDAVLMTRNMAK